MPSEQPVTYFHIVDDSRVSVGPSGGTILLLYSYVWSVRYVDVSF